MNIFIWSYYCLKCQDYMRIQEWDILCDGFKFFIPLHILSFVGMWTWDMTGLVLDLSANWMNIHSGSGLQGGLNSGGDMLCQQNKLPINRFTEPCMQMLESYMPWKIHSWFIYFNVLLHIIDRINVFFCTCMIHMGYLNIWDMART